MVSDELWIRGIPGLKEADDLLTRYFEDHPELRYHGISDEEFLSNRCVGVYFTSALKSSTEDRLRVVAPVHPSAFSDDSLRDSLPDYLERKILGHIEEYGLLASSGSAS